MGRSHIIRRSEVELRNLSQRFRAATLYDFPGSLLYLVGNSAAELYPHRFAPVFQPVDKRFSRQDRSCRYRQIRFGFRPLLQANRLAALQQCFLDHAWVREFVRECARTIWFPLQEVLDHPGVTPAEQAIEVAELFVEIVVALGPDRDRVSNRARSRPDNV